MKYKELSELLKSLDEFLNFPAEQIVQVKLGYLTKKQLEEARGIVRENPDILEEYQYKINCCKCLKRVQCILILYRNSDHYAECDELIPPEPDMSLPRSTVESYCDMFIPDFFRKVSGFEDVPQELPKDFFEEETM